MARHKFLIDRPALNILFFNLLLLTFILSVPMVSSDGEPHEILTLIAVGTGLVAAVIVLIFLILLIDCRNR